MSWTEHDEGEQRCAASSGPVASNEVVARLLHSKIFNPRMQWFRVDELFWPDSKAYSKECGVSDGCSVDRCADLSEDEIRQRANGQAERVEGRFSKGAARASVRAIRDIQVPAIGAAFCVYDDPIAGNAEHSVIRGRLNVATKAQRRSARDQLADAFAHDIAPISEIDPI